MEVINAIAKARSWRLPFYCQTDTSSTWKIALLQTAQYNKPVQKIIAKRWHALGKDQARVQLLILRPDEPTRQKQAQKT